MDIKKFRIIGGSTDNTYNIVDALAVHKPDVGIGNVLDYGAVGDGVADDSEAFNRAINACKAIYIPVGHTFNVNLSISKNNFAIIGGGPVSRVNGKIKIHDSRFVHIKNISCDGNDDILTIENCSYVYIDNIAAGFWANNVNTAVIRGTCQGIYVRSSTFSNGTTSNLTIENSANEVINDVNFTDCWFAYNRENGYIIDQTNVKINCSGIIQALSFVGCEMTNGKYAFKVDGTGTCRYLKFVNSYFDGYTMWPSIVYDCEISNTWFGGRTGLDAHKFSGCKGVKIFSSTFCTVQFGEIGTANVNVSDNADVVISGCTFAGSAKTGVSITTANRVWITQCEFSKDGSFGNYPNLETSVYIDGSFSGCLFLTSNDFSLVENSVVGSSNNATFKYANNNGIADR